MKVRSVVPMRIAKFGYIIVSAIFCFAGLAMIVFRKPSVSVIGNFFGITMIAFGLIKIIGYFSKDLYRLAFQYDLQFGVILFVLGCVVLIKPDNAINFICISFGVCIIADCLFKGKIAFEAKKFGLNTWWLILLLAAIAGIVGLLLVVRPSEVIRVIVILLGLSLLSEGVLNLSVAISLVKIIKYQIPDTVKVNDFKEQDDVYN